MLMSWASYFILHLSYTFVSLTISRIDFDQAKLIHIHFLLQLFNPGSGSDGVQYIS